MASTNQTPHLGLSQWVLTDPFRMDDFNQDNAKIDAAVDGLDRKIEASVANRLEIVKLKEVTIATDNVTQIDIDVSNVNFDDWQYVIIDDCFPASCCIRVNNSSNCSFSGLGSFSARTDCMMVSCGNARFYLHTRKDSRHKVFVTTVGETGCYYGYMPVCTFAEAKTINFISGDQFHLGGKIMVWGVR